MFMQNSTDPTFLNNERILEELGCGSNPFLSTENNTNNNNNVNGDTKLSDDTYHYLQKKLTDANEIISSHSDRENELLRKLDEVTRNNEELRSKNSSFKSEMQVLTARQVTVDQKMETEKRAQASLQERLDAAEKEIQEEQARFKICFDKLKEAESKLVGSDNLAKKMYSLATDSCAQSDVLREEVDSLESLIDTCKSAMSKLNSEKQELSSKLCVVETEYESYEGTMQDALADIDILKEETLRQENYINDTLNRFREIAVHFDSMKAYVSQQQQNLNKCEKEIAAQNNEEIALKKNLKEAECQLDALKKLKETETLCSSQRISELERNLKIMKQNETPSKVKVESLERELQLAKESNIELKGKQESLKLVLERESKLSEEMKNLFEVEKTKREEDLKKIERCNTKIHQLEIVVSEAHTEKKHLEEMERTAAQEKQKCKETIVKLRDELSSMVEEKTVTNERLISAQNQLSSIQDQVLSLEKSLTDRSSEQAQLQINFDLLSKSKEITELELTEKDLKLDTISRACGEKEKAVSDLEEKLNQCQMIFMDNEEKFRAAEKKLNLLQREADEKQAMNERLATTMSDTQHALESEACQKRDVEEKYRSLREEHDRYTIQSENDRGKLIDEMKRVRVAIQTENEQQGKEKKAHEEAIYQLNDKLKQMADIVDTDRDQIQKLQDRVSFVMSKNEELLQKVTQLSEENLHKNDALECVTKEKMALATEFEGCKKESEELRKMLNDANREYEKLKNEVELFEKFWSKQQKQTLQQLQDELSSTTTFTNTP